MMSHAIYRDVPHPWACLTCLLCNGVSVRGAKRRERDMSGRSFYSHTGTLVAGVCREFAVPLYSGVLCGASFISAGCHRHRGLAAQSEAA